MYMRISLVTLAATMLFASTANADHRWRKPRYHFQPLDIFTSSIDPVFDDEEWVDDEDEIDEPNIREMRERRKRWVRVNEDPWWLEDDEAIESGEPVTKPQKKKITKTKPAAKKPLATAALPPKPKAKPDAKVSAAAKPKVDASKPSSSLAVASATPKAEPTQEVKAVAPKITSTQRKTAPVAPKATGKTVGCTGGAAIVTGLGFASVRPRICTGDTFAYMATKSDGNYAIKLKAATGEVVDVAKLP
jgi:hypothetical protein